MRTTAKLTRVPDIAAALRKVRARLEAKLPEGQKKAAQTLLDASQALVPLDTEALKESGAVKEGDGAGFDKVYYVGYGGEFGNSDGVLKTVSGGPGRPDRTVVKVPSEYAVAQHENHAYNHPNGGQANYLGQPGRDAGVQAALRAAIEAAARG